MEADSYMDFSNESQYKDCWISEGNVSRRFILQNIFPTSGTLIVAKNPQIWKLKMFDVTQYREWW